MKISEMIDAFRPAEGPPPRTLLAFFGWCLSGAWPALWGAGVLSALAGTLEVVSALLLGYVIDATLASDPGAVFAENWMLFAWFAGFYLLLRPVIFGLSFGSSSIIIQPNVLPLVLSRLHRWTMGQAVTFFDNDFAGSHRAKADADGAVGDGCGVRGDQRRGLCAGLGRRARCCSCWRLTSGSRWRWRSG